MYVPGWVELSFPKGVRLALKCVGTIQPAPGPQPHPEFRRLDQPYFRLFPPWPGPLLCCRFLMLRLNSGNPLPKSLLSTLGMMPLSPVFPSQDILGFSMLGSAAWENQGRAGGL